MSLDNVKDQQSKEKLIIALDFGTTYSGIAYCFASQRDKKVGVVTEWPNSESAPKIQTLISYHGSGSDTPTKFNWGPSVNPLMDHDTIVAMKLMLDPSQERPFYLPLRSLKKRMRTLPKPPAEICADFMGAMYKHALSQIGKKVKTAYLDMCEKEFVLSVPAVWSDKAKNDTLKTVRTKAAQAAGMSPATLVKEPEAAALWTMHSLGFSLDVGDAFVVCDAGGGTVDLISYEIVATKPTTELKELVPGTGGMSGSLGLNDRFLEAVKDLVGEDQYNELRKTKALTLALKKFDKDTKREFRGDPNSEYFIDFPMANLEDDPMAGLESNTWRITGKTLLEIFQPLVSDIISLIRDQVKSVQIKRDNRGVAGIFLVGGFGTSQYLKSCVEQEFPEIQVLQPTDAWSAIERGAALSRLSTEARVVSVQATKHYGVEVSSLVDSIFDHGQPTKLSYDGNIRCKTMQWYIHKGDDIARDQKIRFRFFRDYDQYPCLSSFNFTDDLIECSDVIAPRHLSKGHRIRTNCSVLSDLHDIDKNLILMKQNPKGETYYELWFSLIVTLESAVMKFSCEVDGKEMGSVVVDYKGDD